MNKIGLSVLFLLAIAGDACFGQGFKFNNGQSDGYKVYSLTSSGSNGKSYNGYYVFHKSNVFEVFRDSKERYKCGWGVCESKKLSDGVGYFITWETGHHEIGNRLAGNQYKIVKQTGDASQNGWVLKMTSASLPRAARQALEAAMKRSIPLDAPASFVRKQNSDIDVAEKTLGLRRSQPARNVREIIVRRALFKKKLELYSRGPSVLDD